MKKKTSSPAIHVITLGCAKNLVDSEFLMGKLHQAGFITYHNQTPFPADIAIVNTCGFIGDAKEESIDTILKLLRAKKSGQYSKVYVMGCLSQRYRTELKEELHDVDGFFGVNEQLQLLHALSPDFKKELRGERVLATPGHYAYLKVSEGCGRNCSFCAIPFIRGKQVSVPVEALVEETKNLVTNGVKEINVIAQDTTQYGLDLYRVKMLPALMEQLSFIEGLEWIRLHYAYPKGFPLKVLEIMKDHPNICRYLDIPLQHINEKILTSMRRGSTNHSILSLLEKIRSLVPDITLRTTLMVGYPGEGEREFRQLYDFVQQQRFSRLGVFTYSAEEGTTAYRLKDSIPERVKQQRQQAIMELQMAVSEDLNKRRIGQVLKVIIDSVEDGHYVGRTEYDSPEVDNEVIISSPNNPLVIGSFYQVRVIDAMEYDLMGEVC